MTIAEWEWETGFMLRDLADRKETDVMTEDEFKGTGYDYMSSSRLIQVDQEGRMEFLKANGYEPTRENMMNIDLPSQAEQNNSAEAQE